MKRKNPYTALLDDVKSFAFKVKYPPRSTMWLYAKERIDDDAAYTLRNLYERVTAADQLGHDVVLIAAPEGLKVQYRKRVDVPYSWAS